ncbi:MAG: hypothetical protein KGJ66_15245 [Alphaproteobacteria bacterium]|nr:hypothetical protein [Alphaproteobacteria bacterium]
MSKKIAFLMLAAALVAFSPLAMAQSAQQQNAQQPSQNENQTPCGDQSYGHVPGC